MEEYVTEKEKEAHFDKLMKIPGNNVGDGVIRPVLTARPRIRSGRLLPLEYFCA
jgi:hypothetical protein